MTLLLSVDTNLSLPSPMNKNEPAVLSMYAFDIYLRPANVHLKTGYALLVAVCSLWISFSESKELHLKYSNRNGLQYFLFKFSHAGLQT